MSQELILTRGLPASGKTTFAKQWQAEASNRTRVNRDDLRMKLFGEWYFTDNRDAKEKKVTEFQHAIIKKALSSGNSVIVDDTNLNPRVFRIFESIASQFSLTISNLDFPVSVEESIARQAGRDKPVPKEAIKMMASKYLGPNNEFHLFPGSYPVKSLIHPEDRKPTIAFDADGTLVDVSSIASLVKGKYRDFDLFHRKSLWSNPNQEVLDLAYEANDKGFKVIVVTAREERYRDVTQAWMDKFNVPYENIFMRPMDDRRPDHIVKNEMFSQINSFYDVVHFVDDRKDIADVWKQNGVETTLVPGGFSSLELEELNITSLINPFKTGKCLKCGRPLKNGGFIGSECAKNA
jgi:predicted kinase